MLRRELLPSLFVLQLGQASVINNQRSRSPLDSEPNTAAGSGRTTLSVSSASTTKPRPRPPSCSRITETRSLRSTWFTLAALAVVIVGQDPASQIYVRNKRPAGMAQFSPAKTVLFVHGATYPSTVTFDYAIDGASWMDVLAAGGFQPAGSRDSRG